MNPSADELHSFYSLLVSCTGAALSQTHGADTGETETEGSDDTGSFTEDGGDTGTGPGDADTGGSGG